MERIHIFLLNVPHKFTCGGITRTDTMAFEEGNEHPTRAIWKMPLQNL